MKLNTDRRRFLKVTSATAIGTTFTGGLTAARAKDPSQLYRDIIPHQKGLESSWVQSLYQSSKPEGGDVQGSKKEDSLKHIGMTVGGIACGTVYLGGDGRLWVWDIFNQHHEGVVTNRVKVPKGLQNIMQERRRGDNMWERDGSNFVLPPSPDSHPNAFEQGFGIQLNGEKPRKLEAKDWSDVNFVGEWPIGKVSYKDSASLVEVNLQAYTPFIPLNLDDSSLPTTIVEIEVANTSSKTVQGKVHGWLENIISQFHGEGYRGQNSVEVAGDATVLHTQCIDRTKAGTDTQPDVLFEDFEKETYGKWKVEGEAFGNGPIALKDIPEYQGKLGAKGKRAVNSHSSSPADTVGAKDGSVGTLTSPEFTITRKYVRMLIGGGKQKGKTCVNLIIDGKVVKSIVGHDHNTMQEKSMDVSALQGKKASLQIVDASSGAWGNIGVDHIVFSNIPPSATPFRDRLEYGDMTLSLLGSGASGEAHGFSPSDFSTGKQDGDKPCGSLAKKFTLKPGESVNATFVITWHFANLRPLPGIGKCRRHYVARFKDAPAVASYVVENFGRLTSSTKLWTKTWYDSTMPKWLLDRTILTTNTLQTQNCFILEDGRFWAWEGIGCCPGTCMHVWHYAQGIARLFPEIERRLREVTDYGVSFHEKDGMIFYRGEAGKHEAIDGQAALIIRTLREHQMSPDNEFLKRIWPKAKKALQFLINFDNKDGSMDGLLHGRQYNTLDAAWYGKIPCLSSLYLAAIRAGEEMAKAMGDKAFADGCHKIHARGSKNIDQLFDGEFYIQEEDPKHSKAIGVSKGCYIDQVIGQFWAHQTGMGRLYSKEHIQSSLHSLWKYNFLKDVGPFRKVFVKGRFYALAGDGGLIMCTWPKGGMRADFEKHWQYVYFNECMTGFEHQVAAHMISEGTPVSADSDKTLLENSKDPRSLTLRGLAIIRAIQDRYSSSKRNPYNEIECSDHYARANASYGSFIAACGYTYDGPIGHMGFDPKLQPENFKSAFIAAEGWGTYTQKIEGALMISTLEVSYGKLNLKQLSLTLPEGKKARIVLVNGKAADFKLVEGQAVVSIQGVAWKEHQKLTVEINVS